MRDEEIEIYQFLASVCLHIKANIFAKVKKYLVPMTVRRKLCFIVAENLFVLTYVFVLMTSTQFNIVELVQTFSCTFERIQAVIGARRVF